VPPGEPFSSSLGTEGDVVALLRRLTGAGLSDVLAMREMTEPHAAAAAVSNATGADVQAIQEAHARATAQSDLEGFEKWDTEFHRLIFAATRNELLIALHDILKVSRNRPSWIALKRQIFTEEKRRAYCIQHAQIADSIARRDGPGAASAMRFHIDEISRNLLRRTM